MCCLQKPFLVPVVAFICLLCSSTDLSAQIFGGCQTGSCDTSVFGAYNSGFGEGIGCGCGGWGMCGRCKPSLRERIWGRRLERIDRRMSRYCNRCSRFNCGCAMPMCAPTCAPTCAPVTTLVPRQVMTYQSVPVTCYRTEAYCETVPVTVYQQQIRYRQVPYQAVRQVPQMTTQMVPMTTYQPIAPVMSGCSTCPTGDGFSGGMPGTTYPGMSLPYPQVGLPGGIPNNPVPNSTTPQTNTDYYNPPRIEAAPDPATSMYQPPMSSGYVPTPTDDSTLQLSPKLDTTWQTIPSIHDHRTGSLDRPSPGYRSLGYDTNGDQRTAMAAGRFSAPTAAGVWQSQSSDGSLWR